MEARYADSEGTFAYNLTNLDVWADRDSAQGVAAGNVMDAMSGWFVAPASGNLHLRATAVDAMDKAAPLADVPADIDGDPRPTGSAPDVGADEYKSLPFRIYLPVILKGLSGFGRTEFAQPDRPILPA